MVNRLAAIREARGLSLSEAARRIGTSPSQLLKLERGGTKLHERWLARIARGYETSPAEILGDGPRKVPLVGYVGAGAQIFHREGDDDTPLETIDGPPDSDERDIAYKITGDSMEPVYRGGDIVIVRKLAFDPAAILERDCAVRVHEGATLFKRVKASTTPGRFHLLSYNPAVEIILDAALDWAAPVRWIKRA